MTDMWNFGQRQMSGNLSGLAAASGFVFGYPMHDFLRFSAKELFLVGPSSALRVSHGILGLLCPSSFWWRPAAVRWVFGDIS